MVRRKLLRDFFSVLESVEPGYRADPIDEYRDLAMLAHAWERRSLALIAAEELPGRVEDAEGKDSALP